MRISNLLYRSYLNCGKISGFVNHYRHKQFNSSCRNYDKVIRKKLLRMCVYPLSLVRTTHCATWILRRAGFSLVRTHSRVISLSLSALVAVLLLFFRALAV